LLALHKKIRRRVPGILLSDAGWVLDMPLTHREREPIECADVLAFFLEIQRLAYYITLVTD
jgi:hypothetical protein